VTVSAPARRKPKPVPAAASARGKQAAKKAARGGVAKRANGHPVAAVRTAPSAAVDDGAPRYLQIARTLTAAISAGTYPVGARLPTELELCARFGISRFTAREAVRVLSSAGLVTRRQRVGTVVIATPADARYTHAAQSVADLFQYAQDTELRLMYIGKLALGAERAAEFGASTGAEWIYAVGIRREAALSSGADGRPICITRLYLNPVLDGIESRLRERKTAVYAIIEREYKLIIQRVEQELRSIALDADDAANLGALAGSPALLVLRRYYDERGQLLEVAENVHPGDRFTYRMQLHK
jgi:GntR family transcriptional regulator